MGLFSFIFGIFLVIALVANYQISMRTGLRMGSILILASALIAVLGYQYLPLFQGVGAPNPSPFTSLERVAMFACFILGPAGSLGSAFGLFAAWFVRQRQSAKGAA